MGEDEAPVKQGKKYLRSIAHRGSGASVQVDVYDVCRAFAVEDACVSHAVKKLLCAGKRGKGSRLDDLRGALESIQAAVAFAEAEAASVPAPRPWGDVPGGPVRPLESEEGDP